MAGNVVRLKMAGAAAQAAIRRIAADSARVIIGTHAKERMAQCDISTLDVFRILRGSAVLEAPEPARDGEWKAKVSLRLRGNRDASVVTVILHGRRLFVKTVLWEDL